MPKGAHQVKTVNDNFVDVEGSDMISILIERPEARPSKITLQDVLYVPACDTNNLLSAIHISKM